MRVSPDRAAAMPNSCDCQSMYAIAYPGSGLINPRSHTLGPKMNLELLGRFRLVMAPNADRSVRLRPSDPTLNVAKRICESELRSSRSGATRQSLLAISRKV